LNLSRYLGTDQQSGTPFRKNKKQVKKKATVVAFAPPLGLEPRTP
jgi:hypothetical protein